LIGRIVALHRRLPAAGEAGRLTWRLRGLPVCASTESELDRWLASPTGGPGDRLERPLAVVARHQRFGHGQQGRTWISPPGGVWLSAALPWPTDPSTAAAPGLAVAVGLALQLEAIGLPVRLKWPNDLLLDGRKLAGLLPRLRLHGGRVRWARVGVGLNGRNPVPPGAANLRLVRAGIRSDPGRLTALVLAALEWAVAWAEHAEPVRRLAERRLLLRPQGILEAGELWWPVGLSADGGLLLACEKRRRVLRRSFETESGLADAGPGRPGADRGPVTAEAGIAWCPS
jgi:BirA family biotin operon repressor/biotin-[acetyl-CoA-carboxylase] ligase